MIPEFFFGVGIMTCYFMASIFWHVHILYLQSPIAWFIFTMLHLNLLVMWISLRAQNQRAMFDLIWPFQWKMFSVHHVLLWKTVKSSDGGCKVFIPSSTLSTTVRCQSSERSRGNETDTVLSESFDCHYNAVWSLGLVANCCLVRVTKSNAKMQLCFQLSKRDQLFSSQNWVWQPRACRYLNFWHHSRLPQWLMSGKDFWDFGLGKSSVLSITELVKDFSGEHDLLSYLLFSSSTVKPFLWTKNILWTSNKLPNPNHHKCFTFIWV